MVTWRNELQWEVSNSIQKVNVLWVDFWYIIFALIARTLSGIRLKNETTITGLSVFVFEENSVRKITWSLWRHRAPKASFSLNWNVFPHEIGCYWSWACGQIFFLKGMQTRRKGQYIEDITRWREDMNFMFEWQEQYLTRSLRSLVRYCFCHENIKFMSASQRVMFFLLYGD